jgi:hypothetical protein
MISRRGIIGGLVGLIAAPAIVKAGSLMPVKSCTDAFYPDGTPVIEVVCETDDYIDVWNNGILIKRHHITMPEWHSGDIYLDMPPMEADQTYTVNINGLVDSELHIVTPPR